MGAGVEIGAEEIQQQRQSPQQALEPSVVTDEAAAATSAMDRWIPAAEGPTGDGIIPGGESGAETVAATFTRGQQEHLVVPSSTPGLLQQQRYRVTPAVTRSRAQPPGVSRTFTLLAAEEDIARTLAQPDAALCDSEELPVGPAHLLETPEKYEQAHAGPHDRTTASGQRRSARRWRDFRRSGLSWRKGERSNEEPTTSRPSGCTRGRRMSLIRLSVLKLGL